MIQINGKYNNATIYTNNLEQEAFDQIKSLCDCEAFKDSKIRIMPDVHSGKGCCIGTTMTLTDKVVPGLVGVDIGCGVLAVKLDTGHIDGRLLDEIIGKRIPTGMKVHSEIPPMSYMMHAHLLSVKAPVNVDYALRSLGTLGGGNHFIEVDEDSHGNFWLVIHTGSRHLGVEIAEHYIPDDLAFVSGQAMKDYLHDMEIAQGFAWFNRCLIASVIKAESGIGSSEEFQTVHNYIDTKSMILRKGAVSAQKGEMLIIPINMHDGSLICMGKGNPDWNFSAPHGAGRLLSRSQAKNLNMEEYRKSMEGIYSTCVCEETLDESPMAYKSLKSILSNIGDTVEVIERLKPVYSYKAKS